VHQIAHSMPHLGRLVHQQLVQTASVLVAQELVPAPKKGKRLNSLSAMRLRSSATRLAQGLTSLLQLRVRLFKHDGHNPKADRAGGLKGTSWKSLIAEIALASQISCHEFDNTSQTTLPLVLLLEDVQSRLLDSLECRFKSTLFLIKRSLCRASPNRCPRLAR
jgi:hypothetical protein